MSQEQNTRRPPTTYFRWEAMQEYIQHHEKTVLPQFISTHLLFFLWLAFALVFIVLIGLVYLLLKTSPVPLFATIL